ncbi:MAG: hypothetical protein JW720_06305 [Sedimentisphaerales bacterium]|nr:hypothetical protein [Sedimentisphaerales bacterium]
MKAFACISLGIMAVAACISHAAAPEPAIVPPPGQWTIDTKFTHPQQIFLRSGVENKPARFWYSIVTLTNNTGREVDFHPKCELKTDTFQIIPTGRNVTPDVFASIKKRHQAMYAFLEPLAKTGNKILRGEDNTKDIALIWPDFDDKAKEIKIFITGLSNELAVVDHPIAKDKDGKPLQIFLRKTLELTYDLESDAASRSDANLIYKSRRWVMR